MADYKKPVVIFGAGATKACGGPLTSEILPRVFEQKDVIEREDFVRELDRFLIANFHLPRKHKRRTPDHYPPLPLLISLIDTAIDRKQGLGPRWPEAKLVRVRRALDYVVYALLTYELKRVANHYRDFLIRLVDIYGTPPVLLSLNYDIIADNSLIKVAKRKGGRETFPDYGCDIATELYRAKKKYGALYKLHGSLNWLYCPGCHRLDLGVSKSGRRTAKVLDMLYMEQESSVGDLDHRYTCKGSPCPDCGAEVRPVMITPTHLKDYRNPHIAQVWYRAERALHDADRAYFVGYSMPEDDVDVIYLLKRGLSHLKAKHITVVEYDPEGRKARLHPVGARYCTLFGERIDWVTKGFEGWLGDL